MANEGPTEDELAKAKAYLKGSYALNFDTSTKIASQLLQIQLDDLGIDYIDKRNGLIDAVTLEDARRAAKRLAEGGMLVTVVGQPKDLSLEGTGRLSNDRLLLRSQIGGQADPFNARLPMAAQAIDRSRAAGQLRARRWRAPREALAWLRARHADGALPLLRLPEKRDDIATILGYAALLRDGTSDVVFLGTGGSSLGGQTLAQLAGHARARRRRACATRRASISWTISTPTATARCCERLPLQTTRFVAVSKSGGTGETLMQTIAALDAREGAPSSIRTTISSASPSRPSPASATACAICLSPHQIRMMDHDPGVGGRFSVLTNVGLLPAAVLRPRHRRDPRRAPPTRWRRCSASKPPAEVPAAVGAALAVALASRARPSRVMMAYADRLERFTSWYVQLWAESLGKDGKGTTPIGALGPVDQHSQLQLFIAGPRDKLFTVITASPRRAAARASTADLAKLAGEPDFAGKTIGDLVAAQGRATAETLAKNGCPVRTIHLEKLDETSARRAADAFHAGDDHRRASPRRRSVRPAGGGRRQGAGEEVSGARQLEADPVVEGSEMGCSALTIA